MTKKDHLHLLLGAVVESLRGEEDSSVEADFAPGVTEDQKITALEIIANFDWSDEAHVVWLEDLQPERKNLKQKAQTVIQNIDDYLAVADTGTSNQIMQRDHQAIKQLAEIMKAVIQRLVQIN